MSLGFFSAMLAGASTVREHKITDKNVKLPTEGEKVLVYGTAQKTNRTVNLKSGVFVNYNKTFQTVLGNAEKITGALTEMFAKFPVGGHNYYWRHNFTKNIYLKPMRLFITSIFLISMVACNVDSSLKKNYKITDSISNSNALLEYMGRIEKTDSLTNLFWSGSSVEIEFESSEISAIIDDENGKNFFNIILDKDSIILLNLDKHKKTYLLASGLSKGRHTIKLFKRTEWTKGKTSFYGFKFNKKSKVYKIPAKKISIEFYGNSITSGHGVEDYSQNDYSDSIYTNNYNSYAAVVSRHYDANYSCISRSGIGISVSWDDLIMPEMYNRLNPNDGNSRWDFKKFTPDVVVVNLLQNDSWLVNKPNFEQFKKRFGIVKPSEEFLIAAYSNFIKLLIAEYPNSRIICVLGNMDITGEGSKWPGYVRKAISNINNKNVGYCFVPYKNTPGHPKIEEQKIIADSIISYITLNTKIK